MEKQEKEEDSNVEVVEEIRKQGRFNIGIKVVKVKDDIESEVGSDEDMDEDNQEEDEYEKEDEDADDDKKVEKC